MNRWLLIGSLAALLTGTTGCLHHNTRGGCDSGACAGGGRAAGSCNNGYCQDGSCSSGACGNGGYGTCNCENGSCGHGSGGVLGSGGLLGKLSGQANGCKDCGYRAGCVPGPLGWQQGGLDYSSHLQPGLLGHHAGHALNNQPFTPGPPTAHVGYPYYTVRGPRDFLVDDPPTIGR